MSDKQLLQRLQHKERLSSSVLAELAFRKDLITVDDVTNNDSPYGQKEYLFISFTPKGQRLLESEG
jgi:hypothetical protein